MAKTAKNKTSIALTSKSAAAIALVPASEAAVVPAKGRKLTPKRAAWQAAYREKQRLKRIVESQERRKVRENELRVRGGYFRLKTHVNEKLRAFTGKTRVRDESDVRSFQLEMISLGKELAQFGDRITAAGMEPGAGHFETCPRLSEALRDKQGVMKKLETLRAELFVISKLHAVFELTFYEPKDLVKRVS